MKTFNEVYAWRVFDELAQGERVCFCDKERHFCGVMNDLSVDAAVAIINGAAENKDRYAFWIEKEKEESKEVKE